MNFRGGENTDTVFDAAGIHQHVSVGVSKTTVDNLTELTKGIVGCGVTSQVTSTIVRLIGVECIRKDFKFGLRNAIPGTVAPSIEEPDGIECRGN